MPNPHNIHIKLAKITTEGGRIFSAFGYCKDCIVEGPQVLSADREKAIDRAKELFLIGYNPLPIPNKCKKC